MRLHAKFFPATVRVVPENSAQTKASPLLLLLRVNVLHSWRRLLAVREQSRLLTSIIGLFIAGYLFVSFELFYHGMKFIAKFPGLGAVLTERLLFTLFAFLFALLLLSNLVISYTNLFRNRETIFLLSLPVPAQTIFRWKFIESTLLASWAFLFLIAPLLAAFGLVRGVPWHFYVMTPMLIAMFIVLPGVLGAAVAIVVGRFLDRRSFQIALVTTALVLLALVAFWWKAQPVDDELLDKRTLQALDQLLAKTRFTMFPFLPSYWLSSAVLQWAEGILRGAAFFALVLLSHTLFFGSLAFTRFGALFYDTASAVQSRGGSGFKLGWFRATRQKQNISGFLEKVFSKFFWLDRDLRALAVKDLRMFWRDTTQWGQSVMLFGLLGIYIINLRNFTHQLTSPFWVNLVAYLNLTACSLNPAIFARRAAAVDCRHGADGAGACRQSQILAGQRALAHHHAHPHHAVVLPAANDVVSRGAVRRGCHRDDIHAQRRRRRPRRAVSQPEGGQPEQNRQRLRRHVVPRVEFVLHFCIHRAAGLWHDRPALARELDG
jgi:ABC-2 type transport system permease protein